MKTIFSRIALIVFLLLVTNQIASADEHKEKIGSGPYDDNCVFYIRKIKGISLPSGLDTMAGKRNIINKDKPKKGRVAIINVGPVGHVALVTNVDDDGKKQSIKLEEANYPSRGYWKRTLTGKKIKNIEKEYHIEGYYKK